MIRIASGARAVALLYAVISASAAPPLTMIQDTLYTADGKRFSGSASIQWKSFSAAEGSVVPMQNLTVRVVDGVLRVQLVPTTNATPGAWYQVRFNSNGRIQFAENWAVPPSAVALKLKDVRIQGPLNGVILPPVSATIAIADVIGLRDELDDRPQMGTGYSNGRAAMINQNGRVESVLGSLTDCVRVDGTAAPCSGGGIAFTDGEIPTGVMNGSNAVFSLANAPAPAASLQLFLNGILLRNGVDYSLIGGSVTFTNGAVPQGGDVLQAWYRR